MTTQSLKRLLEDLQEYFDSRSDIIDSDKGAIPNESMKFLGRIQYQLSQLNQPERTTNEIKKVDESNRTDSSINP